MVTKANNRVKAYFETANLPLEGNILDKLQKRSDVEIKLLDLDELRRQVLPEVPQPDSLFTAAEDKALEDEIRRYAHLDRLDATTNLDEFIPVAESILEFLKDIVFSCFGKMPS